MFMMRASPLRGEVVAMLRASVIGAMMRRAARHACFTLSDMRSAAGCNAFALRARYSVQAFATRRLRISTPDAAPLPLHCRRY